MNSILFLKVFVGLMAIMNPLINLPIFLSLTESHQKSKKLKIALVSCVAVFLILALVAYFGQKILGAFGISVGGFQIAGGILVGKIAWDMLNPSPSKDSGEVHLNPAVVPLAMPIMAGPGAISKIIAYVSSATGGNDFEAIMLAIGCGSALIFLVFLMSDFLNRILGKTGMVTITKIMAILLGAIAIEMLVQGVKSEFGI
ncbi:MAG: MarC family protein [Alphaproteobacteria bacterium]|nr:MarC family protein [Alphaproteobacteria bacterium]